MSTGRSGHLSQVQSILNPLGYLPIALLLPGTCEQLQMVYKEIYPHPEETSTVRSAFCIWMKRVGKNSLRGM